MSKIGEWVRRREESFSVLFAGRRREALEVVSRPGGRRLDWLALLPAPSITAPTLWVTGDFTERDRRRLEQHFDVRVSASVPSGGADVVVASGVSSSSSREAAALLAPDGIAVVVGRVPMGRRSVARLVDASGRPVAVVSRHWVLPRLARARRFVPLDAPASLRWYVRNLFVGETVTGRTMAKVLSSLAPWARWFPSDQAVVLVGSDHRGGEPELVSAVTIEAGLDSACDVIVLTSGFDVGSRTVLMLFDKGAGVPVCAVKAAGRTEMNALTLREHEALRELRSELPVSTLGTVPAPMAAFEWRGRAVSVESAFDGPTLEVVLGEESSPCERIARLDGVSDWLTGVQSAGARPIPWTEEAHRSWIVDTIRRAEERLSDPDRLSGLFDRVRDASVDMIGADIPLVRRHFDLGPWNVIATAAGIGVIDWEFGFERRVDGRGLPLCDLDYFVKYWLHIVGGARSLTDELDLFPWFAARGQDGLDEYRTAARAALDRYIAAIGLDPAFVPMLVAYQWIEHAVNATERSVAMGLSGARRVASAEAYLGVLSDRLRFTLADGV